ncbi:MAG: hypothetical protein ACRDRL_13205, partial [Sciscionella sp.]
LICMSEIIDSISKSIEGECLYPAFMSCVCLPDICGYLDSPTSTSVRLRYATWFEKYVSMNLYTGHVSGDEAYMLRCVVLHNGELATDQYKNRNSAKSIILDKFILASAGSHLTRYQGNFIDGVEQPSIELINVVRYCQDIVEGVKEWQKATGNTLGEGVDSFKIEVGQIDLGGVQINCGPV